MVGILWQFVWMTHPRPRFLGTGGLNKGKMVLDDAGQMVQTICNEIPQYYGGIDIDAFQIMPNHVHGIIVIVGADHRVCPCQNNLTKGIAGKTGQSQGIADSIGQSQGIADSIGQSQGIAPTGGLSVGMLCNDSNH